MRPRRCRASRPGRPCSPASSCTATCCTSCSTSGPSGSSAGRWRTGSGSPRFLGFYLLCGVAAGMAHALLHPFSTVPTIGASGAISGVLGCYVRYFPAARLVLFVPILFLPWFFEVPAIVFALFWLVTQIVPGLFALGAGMSGGIAWWAHIGGFAAGWLLAPWLRERRRRCFYGDECRFGLSPHGRRRDPRLFWD
ncbi:MAG: rhomboid family intramembrane serine protease [Xanthomonadales bacterium]|nr:rhomboid family intramembrane serine protease [Xanthomonadales bacterium]